MSGYTKLFSSIVTSTIWRESDHVRLVWVTMLALADKYGVVEASVPGLADLARVSRSLCDDALKVLMSPDPDSRTKDHDGRRLVAVDGGWQLVNHGKYRDRMSAEDQKAKKAAYMRAYRSTRKDDVTDRSASVNDRNQPLPTVAKVPQSESDTESEPKADQTQTPEPAPAGKVWSAEDWRKRFADAWGARYGGFYGRGGADGKAVTTLSDVLEALPVKERQAAQLRAGLMFTEFLALGDQVARDRHPFVFFVARFNGLRVEKKPDAAVATGDYCGWHKTQRNNGKASNFPRDTCPECRHVKALNGTRVSDVYQEDPMVTDIKRRRGLL